MGAMLCKNPYVTSAGVHGCGQCMPCRFNARRVWVHRLMLEAAQYEDNSFVTLTYSDENLPEGGTLVPDHYRLWLKRLRERIAPLRIRFFLVGEYGDKTFRPHYHAALFNFASCRYGQSQYSPFRKNCCAQCDLVRDTWRFGNVLLGTLEDASAGYMAGYVTKKMTRKDDGRLNGRHPEFGRMSLRPGIGGDAMWEIADSLMKYEIDEAMKDVPTALRHGKKQLPLGRYLRNRVRSFVGREARAPQAVIDEMAEELRPMRMAARSSSEKPSVKTHVVEANEPRIAGLEARERIHKQRKSL